MDTKRNFSKIVRGKILDATENSSLQKIAVNGGMVCAAVCLSIILTFPEQTLQLAENIAYRKNAIILKTAISFLVVFNAKSWVSFVASIKIKETNTPSDTNIEGIPISELLDHLFTVKSFKRDDIEKKFGIPRNRFSSLANKMEELQILMRGDNNSRILNPSFTRSDIASIFSGVECTEDLKPVFRQTSENSWSILPIQKMASPLVATDMQP